MSHGAGARSLIAADTLEELEELEMLASRTFASKVPFVLPGGARSGVGGRVEVRAVGVGSASPYREGDVVRIVAGPNKGETATVISSTAVDAKIQLADGTELQMANERLAPAGETMRRCISLRNGKSTWVQANSESRLNVLEQTARRNDSSTRPTRVSGGARRVEIRALNLGQCIRLTQGEYRGYLSPSRGDRVRVVNGRFKGQEGIIVSASSVDAIVMLATGIKHTFLKHDIVTIQAAD
jgi:ribosomal protein L24